MKFRVVHRRSDLEAPDECRSCGAEIRPAASYTHHVLRTRLHARAGIGSCQMCAQFELERQRAHIEWDD